VVVSTVGLAGGGGSAAAKTSSRHSPVLLSLASHDDGFAGSSYAAAVRKLSHGSITIVVENAWRDHQVAYERGIVADVRTGQAELGVVGVRVWDTLGVTGFRALVAPFLIDSLALEGSVLRSPRATQTLTSLARAGVVGLAVMPGVLRRPLGIRRGLVSLQDYRGATIGIPVGALEAETFAALGGRAKESVPGSLAGLDGAELDLGTIAAHNWDLSAVALTANIVFWPRIQTVFMNAKVYRALTPAQRQILVRAGRVALALELVRIAHEESDSKALICTHGKLKLETATSDDLTALRAAVQPLYGLLNRDPRTKAWIAGISKTRQQLGVGTDAVACP